MADLKISQLTGATTPLAGTEVLPIVQGGVTKKVSVADLTAGRAVASAGGTFSDNFVQGTAAKGVNFTANTPAAGMTSQLLNWYEEGTWTATLTGSTAAPTTPVTVTATYTRIGRQVTVQAKFYNVNTTGATGDAQITGLPFTTSSDWFVGTAVQSNISTSVCVPMTLGSTTTMTLTAMVGGATIPINAGTGRYLFLTLTYFI